MNNGIELLAALPYVALWLVMVVRVGYDVVTGFRRDAQQQVPKARLIKKRQRTNEYPRRFNNP